MKRFKVFWAAALIFFVAAILSVKPLISYVVAGRIQGLLAGSKVSIGRCALDPLKKVVFYDLRVKGANAYDLKVGKVSADYRLRNLLRGKISAIHLGDVSVDISAQDKTLKALLKELRPKASGGGFAIDKLELSRADIKIKTSDILADGYVSLVLNVGARSLENIELRISRMDFMGFGLENLLLRNISVQNLYRLNIAYIQYNKVRLSNINAKISVTDKRVVVSPADMNALGGTVFAGSEIVLGEPLIYSLNLEAKDLNVLELVDYFKLKEKFEMTGNLSGNVSFQGIGDKVNVINGNLSLSEPGGVLTIKDNNTLENIAGSTQQSFKVVADSFKDYRYSTGAVKVALGGNNLNFNVNLNGRAGKRTLDVVWHDFNLAALLDKDK